MSRPSSIRVFVDFKDDGVVFAGEDIQCTITFKNVERSSKQSIKPDLENENYVREKTRAILEQLNAARARVAPSQKNTNVEDRSNGHPPGASERKHRPSLHIVDQEEKHQPRTSSIAGFHIADTGRDRRHSRSVSIKSLGSPPQQQRSNFRHERSSSIQNSPTRGATKRKTSSGSKTPISLTPSSSVLQNASTSFTTPNQYFDQNDTTSPERPATARQISRPTDATSSFSSPNLSRTNSRPSTAPSQSSNSASLTATPTALPPSSPHPFGITSPAFNGRHLDSINTSSKVLALRDHDPTPRESMELYAHSNKSDETLVSELPTQPTSRLLRRLTFPRLPSQLGSDSSLDELHETLMMGYVQIAGTFTLDESLVNQAPFEEVKRRAVVGGQAGGGVVGVKPPQSDTRLFGALKWNTIGESLGDLLGSGLPSSFKEMKGIADSKSIPLLSTPKSILFVDLQLGPGESKGFDYTFRMPRGLPSSYRGRAIKVSYNMIIVVQRPGTGRNQPQQIKQVEIPFRVFSGVNTLGESLDHDLMSPYIILQETAQIVPVDQSSQSPARPQLSTTTTRANSSSIDFQSYVNHLLTQPRQNSTAGILSPTTELDPSSYTFAAPGASKSYVPPSAAPTSRALIEHAIRQTTILHTPTYIPSRYTIARSSIPIATLLLSRPSLKLGDLLTLVLDFADSKLPCYALEASLESSERVDPALAIRSPQSVERATRRVWATAAESCLWARRTALSLQVPVSATPGFGTTGVSLEWCLRLEFVVGKESSALRAKDLDHGPARPSSELPARFRESGDRAAVSAVLADVKAADVGYLLDAVSADDRGTVLAAKRKVRCDSFAITIPIRVFGATVGSGEDASAAEGLPI